MHSLLLFDIHDRRIAVEALSAIFGAIAGFQDVRQNTPAGTSLEATYIEGPDFTAVRLNSKCETISINGTSGVALKVAWILRTYLSMELRMVDTEYSFDLVLTDYKSIEDLETAIDTAREAGMSDDL